MAPLVSNEVVSFCIRKENIDIKLVKCKNYENYMIFLNSINQIIVYDMDMNIIFSNTIILPTEEKINDIIFSENICIPYISFCISTSLNSCYICCIDIHDIKYNRRILINEKPTSLLLTSIYTEIKDENYRDIAILIGQKDGVIYALDMKMNSCKECENGSSICCNSNHVSGIDINKCFNKDSHYKLSSIHNKFLLYEHDIKLECTSLYYVEKINTIIIGFINGDYAMYDYENLRISLIFRDLEEHLSVKQFLTFKLEDDQRSCMFLIILKNTISPYDNNIFSTISIQQIWYKQHSNSNKYIFSTLIPRCKIMLNNLHDSDMFLHLEDAQIIKDLKNDGFCNFTIFGIDKNSLERKKLFCLIFDYNIYFNNPILNIINIYLKNGHIYSKENNLQYIYTHEISTNYINCLSLFGYSFFKSLSNYPYNIRLKSEIDHTLPLHYNILLYSIFSDSIIQLIHLNYYSNHLYLLEKQNNPIYLKSVPDKFKLESFIRNIFHLGHITFFSSIINDNDNGVNNNKDENEHFKKITISILIEVLDECRDRIHEFNDLLFQSYVISSDTLKELHFHLGTLQKLSTITNDKLLIESIKFQSLKYLLKYTRLLLSICTISLSNTDKSNTFYNTLWPRDEYNEKYIKMKAKACLNHDNFLFIDKIINQLNEQVNSNNNDKSNIFTTFHYPPLSLQQFIELVFLTNSNGIPIVESLLIYITLELEEISQIYKEHNLAKQVIHILELNENWVNSIKSLWFIDHYYFSKCLKTWKKIDNKESYIYIPNQQYFLIKKCFENANNSNLFYDIISNYSQFHLFNDCTKLMVNYIVKFNFFEYLLSILLNQISSEINILKFIIEKCIENNKLQTLLIYLKSKLSYRELYLKFVKIIPNHALLSSYNALLENLNGNLNTRAISSIPEIKKCSNLLLKNSALICLNNTNTSLNDRKYIGFNENFTLKHLTYDIDKINYIQALNYSIRKNFNNSRHQLTTISLESVQPKAIDDDDDKVNNDNPISKILNFPNIPFSHLEYFLTEAKRKVLPKRDLSVIMNDSPLRSSFLKKRKHDINSEEIFENDTPKKIRFDLNKSITNSSINDAIIKQEAPIKSLDVLSTDHQIVSVETPKMTESIETLLSKDDPQIDLPIISEIIKSPITPPFKDLNESVDSKTIETFISSSIHFANITSTQKSHILEDETNIDKASATSSTKYHTIFSEASTLNKTSDSLIPKKRGRGRPRSNNPANRKSLQTKNADLTPIVETKDEITTNISELESSIGNEAQLSKQTVLPTSRLELYENYLAGAHYYKLRPRKNRDESQISINSISQSNTSNLNKSTVTNDIIKKITKKSKIPKTAKKSKSPIIQRNSSVKRKNIRS